ncbi:MAG: hypothetical protein ABI239_11920 [Aquihabitans sp.]
MNRRPVRQILYVVAAAVVIIIGLAVWTLTASYSADVAGHTVSCDPAPAGAEQACKDVRDERRRSSMLIGAGVATVAAAVSTWPSRRLTDEKLNPDLDD